MQDIYLAWNQLFQHQESLLNELKASLESEGGALLSSDFELLRKSTLLKEKATRKWLQAENTFKILKQKTAQIFELPEKATLAELFSRLTPEQAQELNTKRNELKRLAIVLKNQNKFHFRCIDKQVKYLSGWKSVIHGVTGEAPSVYTKFGIAKDHRSQGRLISRSL